MFWKSLRTLILFSHVVGNRYGRHTGGGVSCLIGSLIGKSVETPPALSGSVRTHSPSNAWTSLNPSRDAISLVASFKGNLPTQPDFEEFTYLQLEPTSNLDDYRKCDPGDDLLTPEETLSFLTAIHQGTKPLAKHTRYSQVTAFFNFITQNLDPDFRNPCHTPILKKLYRPSGPIRWKILEKEVMDGIIFPTTKSRNRLLLELMARGGMRIGEALKLTPDDIEDRKLILRLSFPLTLM